MLAVRNFAFPDHRTIVFIYLSVFLLSANILQAQRLYVDASAVGNKDGTSWSNAYTELQVAIKAATPGAQIWIAGGVYTPTTTKKRTMSFEIKSDISLFGGFAGTETNLTDRNIGQHQTILSGNIGNTSDTTDNSYHVLTINVVAGDTVRLDGFIISGGASNKDSTSVREGAGMQIVNTEKVRISNCIIERNVSFNAGGGVYLIGSSPLFVNCVIRNNGNNARSFANGGNNCTGNDLGGAGVFNNAGSPIFRNCIFETNYPGLLCSGYISMGSSFFSKDGGGYFTHCRFVNNRANLAQKESTSIIYGANASLSFFDCLFDDNVPSPISLGSGALSVERSTFKNGKSGAIHASGTTMILKESIFQDNEGITIVDASLSAEGSLVWNCVFANNLHSEGALHLYESVMTIDKCVFENNKVGSIGNRVGGAICNYRSSFTVANSDFTNNEAGQGGAIFNEGLTSNWCKPVIRSCSFYRNYADEGTVVVGGADIHNNHFSDALIENCIHTGSISGAAITNSNGTSTIIGCAISGNHRTGIYNITSAVPKITNCTLSNNGDFNIYNYTGSPLVINTIFNGSGMETRSGTPTVMYSLFPTAVSGTGNIQATNVLIDADGIDNVPGTPDDDLRTNPNAGSINGGTTETAGLQLPAIDIAGNNRIISGRIDMGAYEYIPAKQSQTISFAELVDKTYGDGPVMLVATSSSGLAVGFKVSGPAVLTNNNQLNISGAGAVSVTAFQLGNDNFSSASPVIRDFQVNKASQEITFEEIESKRIDDESVELAATSSSGLAVEFSVDGPAEVKANLLLFTGAGTITITASQSGNDNFNEAVDVIRSFEVDKVPQELTFDLIPNKQVDDEPFTIHASASSGLPVVFQILSGPGSLDLQILTITGPGQIAVQASQPGNDFFLPVTEEQTFYVDAVLAVDGTGQENVIRIFPNPTDSWVFVMDDNGSSSSFFTIFDTNGQRVAKNYRVGEQAEVSALPSGIYIVEIIQKDKKIYKRLVKK